MIGLLRGLLNNSTRTLKKLQPQVEHINSLEPQMEALSEEALQAKTAEFKQRLSRGESLDELLPEAFAVVRETSRRVLGMRPFDVQLLGGVVLHQGRIAEMKTGEGKTLAATLPVYLNALAGKGVHVVTVNDYLAGRDSEWMGGIYRFLGLSVGLIVHGQDPQERKKAYACDITYGTNNEFGFDYLRDNMALHPEQLAQRELNYAIIDEVDSILIDEARTPLIISGQADKPTDIYYKVDTVVKRLRREGDVEIDEKANTVTLTEQGTLKVEKMLGIPDLFVKSDQKSIDTQSHVNQALRAYFLMKRDRDYVVKDGQVVIVDEFTGRLMFGRRFGEGLHQAIEAKEGVKIEKESQTLATITFQNYFRMYRKLAGMTGTALTEEEEFENIYGMDVVEIPTHKPMIRQDHQDVVFRTEEGKFQAVVEEIEQGHRRGQPCLVGTVSIEKSERLNRMLSQKGIPHQVLNAKYHEKEAQIIAQAGQEKAVTIATNMAGRGVDIVLGGNPESELQEAGDDEVKKRRIREEWQERHRRVVAAGGLHIIGTERHESRRIDNQLRGRAGRQGDPGSSRFYVSLEDDLMRLFGSESMEGLMNRIGMDDSAPVNHPLISRSIESAQKKVEARNFEIRKHVLQFDGEINKQREIIYAQRRRVLEGENLKSQITEMIEKNIDQAIDMFSNQSEYPEEWDLKGLLNQAERIFLPGHDLKPEQLKTMEKEEVRELLQERALAFYEQREIELGAENLREMERLITLRHVDEKWIDHISAMDRLRREIGLRAYGQKNPLMEYKREGFEMFTGMINALQEDIVRWVTRASVVERPRQAQVTSEGRTSLAGGQEQERPRQPLVKKEKIGRNDPCPCQSGKKYKKCCGAQ